MPATIETVRHEDQTTTEWTGGTSTQLAIYPTSSHYADRTFKWRLSSATVNLPESQFTPLPGYQRILMVLAGKLRIVHENRGEASLLPFEQHAFDGGWTTTGFGRCVDFNLMMADGVTGNVQALEIRPGEQREIPPSARSNSENQRQTLAIYVVNGDLSARYGETSHALRPGDCFLLHESGTSTESLSLDSPRDGLGTRIVLSRITS